MKEVTVPKTVTEIDDYAFGYNRDKDFNYTKVDGFRINYVSNTAGHLYAVKNRFTDEVCLLIKENDDGTVTITGYGGNVSDLVIPSDINGKQVTQMAMRVLSAVRNLQA